jgi:general secretion pathway protein B
MSFILDALKKSEIERQRQSVPGLVDSGIARPRPRLPVWAVALSALLAVNLIVLLAVLGRGWMTAPSSSSVDSGAQHRVRAATTAAAPGAAAEAAADTPGVATPTVATPGVTAPTATTGQFSPLDTSPMYAPEIPVAAAPAPSPGINKPLSSGSSGPHVVHRRDPLLNDEDYKADDEEVLPTINEINLTGAQALPELHLDVHVFATRSAERFVYINMRKYHEGTTLQEGPTIERIRRDGVILNYHTLRFLLPRQ